MMSTSRPLAHPRAMNLSPLARSAYRTEVGDDSPKRAIEPPPESPIRRILRLRRSPQFSALSERTRDHFVRIANPTVLHASIIDVLDHEYVPQHVCKWIAWARRHQDRAVRLGLALLMRCEANLCRPGKSVDGWAWPRDSELAVAERIFWTGPVCARLVRTRLIAPPDVIPDPVTFTLGWEKGWSALREALADIDAEAFRVDVKRVAAAQLKKRRRKRKRVRLSATGAAMVDALRTLEKGVITGELTGDLTLGELMGREIEVRGRLAKDTKKGRAERP